MDRPSEHEALSVALERRIASAAIPLLEGLGFELVAVEWGGDGRGALLRVSIDRSGGVGADDCARASEHLSQLLDELDPIPAAYRLEVSSPGIERPVQRASDFAKFEGYRAKLRLAPGHPRRRFSGVLKGISSDGMVSFEADGAVHTFPIDAVERAHLVLDLEEYMQLAEGATEAPAGDEEDSP
jgi:ribosome maturation factor RimP